MHCKLVLRVCDGSDGKSTDCYEHYVGACEDTTVDRYINIRGKGICMAVRYVLTVLKIIYIFIFHQRNIGTM